MSIKQITECLTKRYLTEGKNIDKTFQQYKDKLRKKFLEYGFIIDSEENIKALWDKILSKDPTYKKDTNTTGDYGIWLTNLFLNSDKSCFKKYFCQGDALSDLLKEFSTKKPNLEKKDINQYKSIEEVKQVLGATPLSKKQRQRQLQDIKNIAPEDLIYQGDDWSVFSPSSYDSSCALRKGADWCTGSTESAYHYKNYTRKGKLYVIINNANPSEKYQAYVLGDKDKVEEFKNARNRELSFHKFLEDKPELQQCFYDKIVASPRVTVRVKGSDGVVYDGDVRLIALADKLGVDPYDIEELGNYKYEVGDRQYLVLTYDEAYERAIDHEEELLEADFSNYDNFARDYGGEWLFTAAMDSVDDRVYDTFAEDRIRQDLEVEYDWDEVLDKGEHYIAEDFNLPQFEANADILPRELYFDVNTGEPLDEDDVQDGARDALISVIASNLDGYDSGQVYCETMFDPDELWMMFRDSVNWRTVARQLVDAEGVAAVAASYDGREIELNDEFSAYRVE